MYTCVVCENIFLPQYQKKHIVINAGGNGFVNEVFSIYCTLRKRRYPNHSVFYEVFSMYSKKKKKTSNHN
jgi:hypothetical protein